MPSTPRGSDVATLLAVIVAIVLALGWLGSSDGDPPPVPAGLAVEAVPMVLPEEPAAPSEAAVPASGIEGERAGGERTVRRAKRRHADRAGGREDARPPAGGGWARTRSGQDPPATAPVPSAGSGAGASGAPPAPEFALE